MLGIPIEFVLLYSQTLAFIFVAIASLTFVHYQRVDRRKTQLRKTMEFLSYYTKGMIIPLDAIEALSPHEFVAANLENKTQKHNKNTILEFLNSYEFISLNIQRNIIDEDLTRDFMNGNVLLAFKLLHLHIIAIRESTNNPKLYSEFEAVARKWGRK